MGNSTRNLRRGWLVAGQKTAQVVVFLCVVALVGLLLAVQWKPEGTTPPLAFPQRTPTLRPVSTSSSQDPVPPVATQAPLVPDAPYVPRIGIVAGHWWLDEGGQQSLDVGAVCDEGTPNQLTELEINLEVSQRVVFALREAGYQTDLLQEWDDRLGGYQADVLVSIHTDACTTPEASGFKVARVTDSHVPEIEDRLVACLVEHYAGRTGLPFHEGSITHDMTQYHTFYEIDPNTPGAIIEIGFMLADRPLLTRRPDLAAQGIIDGIECFLVGEGIIEE